MNEKNRNSDGRTAGPLDLVQIRARLESDGGQRLWRSLEELAGTPEYQSFLHDEIPDSAASNHSEFSRRDVLKFMAASAALAGLSGCTRLPTEKIVPYAANPPEQFIPGKPLFYATSMPAVAGVGAGVLVESHMGRPTKIEGNASHPSSMGATDIFAQASVLSLYDPDRSQAIVREGRISSWSAFFAAMRDARNNFLGTKGAGLRILTETISSPSLADQIRNLLKEFPGAKWHQYEPCGRDNAREGARLAFGKYVNTVYRFDRAEVVLSLDADFLCAGPGHVRYAWDFTNRRRADDASAPMNRLYVVESTPTSTGAMADHRLPLRARDVEGFARMLAGALGAVTAPGEYTSTNEKDLQAWVRAVARDLANHKGSSIVLAGDEQPPIVHALAHALNAKLGNEGKTLYYAESLEANPANEMDSLRELVGELDRRQVRMLLILGANPAFHAPAEFDFVRQMLNAEHRVHLGLYHDETAEQCHWHVPEAHYLESWGDVRAHDGTIGIIQPLIAPLYAGKTPHEILDTLTKQPGKSAHDYVSEYWKSQRREKDFKVFWEKTLHDGLMSGTALPPVTVKLNSDVLARIPSNAQGSGADELEIVFRPDPTIGDGRFANNGWLQELPKPITHLTWDNAAMLSPATAQRLGLQTGDYVKLTLEGRTAQAPVWISPGHADNSVTVHLGYGRRRAGRLGTRAGFDANLLRTYAHPWIASGLRIEKTGKKYALATTQHHNMIGAPGQQHDEESTVAFNRELVRIATLEEFHRNPAFAQNPAEKTHEGLSFYPGYKYEGYAWGMAVDLNRCIGCGACAVACQAENNIAVVGKDQVARGREMHWIRVDTYFRGGLDRPEMYNEPVLCMHCENAPCEAVCPVGATTHSAEGLNEMTYNRCVGTRYCSNNCPYKVRRFNFKLFSDYATPSLFGVRNPNVTVRSRGVMEKCTYCVQRINAAKIQAEKEDRSVRDGEIVTACQAACPAQALVFGNINDPNSRVSRLKAEQRNYGLLTELNTRPRTTYLAKLRNPNPELAES